MRNIKTSNYAQKIELLKLLKETSKEASNLKRMISGITSSLAASHKIAA